MKILIFGLPGAGKTWLAERLQKHIPNCAWFNADRIREMADDWDFTPEGRLRQATRMKNIADYERDNNRWVICDFVCPTKHTREMFDADLSIWVDTISEGRFEDTNKMFEIPSSFDYHVNHFYSDQEILTLAEEIVATVENDHNISLINKAGSMH
jgi:adenylylsulfate kinase